MADAEVPAATASAVQRLAEREARAHLLVSPYLIPGQTPPLAIEVVQCPVCGAGLETAVGYPPALPVAHGALFAERDGPVGLPVLDMLGCEVLSARALLPTAAATASSAPVHFQTRAAAWARLIGAAVRLPSPDRLMAEVEAAEARSQAFWSWNSVSSQRGSATAATLASSTDVVTLPTSARLNPLSNGTEQVPTRPSFLSPHLIGIPSGCEALYRRHLIAAVSHGLRRPHSQ